MPLTPDPYRVLGVSRGATLDEVRRAYRRLAKVNHPDAAGPSALPRFLAIQAAYEQVARSLGATTTAGPSSSTGRRRPSSGDQERSDATRRAYGGRSRDARPGAPPRTGPAAGSSGRTSWTDPGTRDRRGRASSEGAGPGDRPGSGARADDADPRGRRPRGKATLGSTSYDGADGSPFEPDWGGASWYGTTSGTYWTINPKEYADPRKHGPEYQARARRTWSGRAQAPGEAADAPATDHPDPAADPDPERVRRPTHTTASWWESTAGPDEPASPSDDEHGRDDPIWREPPAGRSRRASPGADPTSAPSAEAGGPAPDPARAAIDLGRALTDPRSGGVRGRIVRGVIGWLPIAFGLGWVVGELTGCGRFAATCDPSVEPLTAVAQTILLGALLLLPELAAIAAGAALLLIVAATAASLILSATGAAADEGSRRGALGALLAVAWLSGLAIAVVRRIRLGPRGTGPVS